MNTMSYEGYIRSLDHPNKGTGIIQEVSRLNVSAGAFNLAPFSPIYDIAESDITITLKPKQAGEWGYFIPQLGERVEIEILMDETKASMGGIVKAYEVDFSGEEGIASSVINVALRGQTTLQAYDVSPAFSGTTATEPPPLSAELVVLPPPIVEGIPENEAGNYLIVEGIQVPHIQASYTDYRQNVLEVRVTWKEMQLLNSLIESKGLGKAVGQKGFYSGGIVGEAVKVLALKAGSRAEVNIYGGIVHKIRYERELTLGADFRSEEDRMGVFRWYINTEGKMVVPVVEPPPPPPPVYDDGIVMGESIVIAQREYDDHEL
jgi:hypothetical protein